MARSDREPSEVVIYTVSEAIDEDPVDLPPLQETISSDALDDLFHEGKQLPGAYTVFPYAGVWVMVHSDATVDVFREYAATNAVEDLPDGVEEPTTDEDMVVLHAESERYTFHDDDLGRLHEIVDEADDSEEAWENSIEYAERR